MRAGKWSVVFVFLHLCICVLDHSLSLGLLNDHDGEEHDEYCDVDGGGCSLDFQMTRCNCVFL